MENRIHCGDITVTVNLQLDTLTEVSGSLTIKNGCTFTAPELTKVSGFVDIHKGATFTAPKLTNTGYVSVHEGATFSAPKLIH